MASAELSPSIKITLQLMRPDTGNDWVFCRPIGRVSDIGCVHVYQRQAENSTANDRSVKSSRHKAFEILMALQVLVQERLPSIPEAVEQRLTPLIVFSPHAGPSGAYSPDGTMGYMMGDQQMMHRPPGDPAFHNQYAHYPAEYYGHHL
ncbi:hypothetical protein HUJ05_013266 [Dendroctonus ponderosae]|nr:hypothetical protein HUJ05_013266 [Dendroctonus ponderosae]